MLQIGDKAPTFKLPTQGDGTLSIPTGNPLVLYFYPKDNTPGCTIEAKEFTDLKPRFSSLGIDIVGMSPDSVTKHDKFVSKHDLGITLVSDEDKSTLEAYGVWVEKSMYGRTYMGVERTTLLIDETGEIVEIWRKVKVKGHVEAVLATATDKFDPLGSTT